MPSLERVLAFAVDGQACLILVLRHVISYAIKRSEKKNKDDSILLLHSAVKKAEEEPISWQPDTDIDSLIGGDGRKFK